MKKKLLLQDHERLDIPARIFGAYFPFRVEPSIFNIAAFLSGEYSGGYWLMYKLENGGFYMAPNAITLPVKAENGYEGPCPGMPSG